MNDDEVTFELSVPLDSDGFLRRECPTCEREFKWLPDHEDVDGEATSDNDYFCPYCGVQAPPGSWLTQAQLELVENIVLTEVVDPMLEDFGRTIENIGRRSDGFIQVSTSFEKHEELDPLTASDDMKRIDFRCHPSEPLKVVGSWEGPVRCLVCGDVAN